jgi:hypothetical protein
MVEKCTIFSTIGGSILFMGIGIVIGLYGIGTG